MKQNPQALSDPFDGEWHRLHRGTPYFRGGIFVLAAIGVLISQFRDILIEQFFPFNYGVWTPSLPGDLLLWIIGGAVLVLVVIMLLFTLSWRMHTFRITGEAIEVRSGIVFRSHRKARIDRIQGINIQRPIIPRIFSAAKLEISGAGSDSSVSLNYLSSDNANLIRRGLLQRASGQLQTPEVASAQAAGATTLDRTVNDFLAPELDDLYIPQSLVKIPIPRLIFSALLGWPPIILLLFIAAVITSSILVKDPEITMAILFSLLPGALAFAGYFVSQIRKKLRYSIAQTPHGVRVGYGLISLSNDTVPAERIHAIEIRQPLFWRKVGWWSIEVNRATSATENGAGKEINTTILPVGDYDDVLRVLTILLPHYDLGAKLGLLKAGMIGSGTVEGYQVASKRAIWYQPLSWRRNGWNYDNELAVLRTGALSRKLSLIPFVRVQSVSMQQGLFAKFFDLARVELDLVTGPVVSSVKNMDSALAMDFFARAGTLAVAAVARETPPETQLSHG
ncbi:MAG: PH domain-containing protein [Microbacteriaceae bacterium]